MVKRLFLRSCGLFSVLACAALVSSAFASETAQPYERDFVLTAYYSPLPTQCCFVKGTFEADVELNGNGTHGADGTPVYAGMVAAPKDVPFGTRIDIPGVGVMTVHDRGGAIVENKKEGYTRIDVWAGTGEEGLARALAFGVKRIRGTVYPPGSSMPDESFDIASLPSPLGRLREYIDEFADPILRLRAAYGEKSLSVKILQETLATLGHFTQQATGFFGDQTRQGLRKFCNAVGIPDCGDTIDARAATYLSVAIRRKLAMDKLKPRPVAPDQETLDAKRELRFLGFYKGRTTPVRDAAFADAVLAFQKANRIVSGNTSPGAGTFGPATKKALIAAWQSKLTIAEADRLISESRVDELLVKRKDAVTQFVGSKDTGDGVKRLQSFLVAGGYLRADRVTGTFGAETKSALVAYQLKTGIIKKETDKGAGYAGPATLLRIRQDQRSALLRTVRARGWEAVL